MITRCTHPSRRIVRFGPFEVDVEAGELRKEGSRIGLQEQPFRVLCVLLDRPGETISREDLRARIWPADTFVDFAGSLNIAILKVRQALGDSAKKPRYIETVPRRGYRFVSAVEAAGSGVSERASVPARASERAEVPPHRHRGKGQRAAIWAAGLALAAVPGTLLLHPVVREEPGPVPWKPVPLTASTGFEAQPALSPDGKRVAFTWNGEKQDQFDIYISAVHGSGRPVRITWSTADETSPAWSRDGEKIAFLRKLGGQSGELVVIAARGGPEHKLADIQSRELDLMRLTSLSWSPNGEWVAVSHMEAGEAAASIFLFSLTGKKRRLTTPPAGFHGDYIPAFSPTGDRLAFCRLAGFSTSEINVISLDGDLSPQGTPRSLTSDKRWSVNPIWVRGGTSILHLYSEHPSTRHQLRERRIEDGAHSTQTVAIPDEPHEISASENVLVYSKQTFDTNIWRARIPRAGEPPALAERFIASTRDDEKPSYSPDGSRLAFVSKRSGSDEVWIARSDGTDAYQLTKFGGPLVGVPEWSPDGQTIVLHARPEGQADLFAIPAAGGAPVRLTNDAADDVMPSYSRDGQWIYFASRRSGEYGIWKIQQHGGAAVQIPGAAGTRALESFAGGTLYYHSGPELDSILRIPAPGGSPEKVSGRTQPFPAGFALTRDGLYYPAAPHLGRERYINFVPLPGGKPRPAVVTQRPVRLGMSVSPDGRYLAFDQLDESGSDLMVVPEFRLP